jgi:hypothetical protein
VLRVLFNFSGDGDKKLTLRAGETVTFLELTQGGWARGFDCRGRNGFFPFAFCRSLNDEDSDEEEEDSVAEVDSLIQSLQKKGSGLSGEAEAKTLVNNNNNNNATVRYEVTTKTVKRTAPLDARPKTVKAAEPERTAPKEVKRPPSSDSTAASAPHSPSPVPLPVVPSSPPPERSATFAGGPTSPPPKRPQVDPERASEFVAYSTTMLPAADPLANVMQEIRQSKRKKGWKIGVTRAVKVPDATTTGNIRINSLELRIKQLEHENKLLQARVGRCGECGSDKVVCLVCEARREKPLPVPRDSVWQSLEEAANTVAPPQLRSSSEAEETNAALSAIEVLSLAAKPLPIPRDSIFPTEEIGDNVTLVRLDVRTLDDLTGEPNPHKKPLPIPRDTTMPETRESVWFFQDDTKK